MDKPSAARDLLHEDICLKQKWYEGKKKHNKFVIHLGILHVRPAWLSVHFEKGETLLLGPDLCFAL